MRASGNPRDARPEPALSSLPRLMGLLGAGYWLCALAINPFTLGWIFDGAAISSDIRFGLGAFDAILLALGFVTMIGRSSERIATLNLVIVSVFASAALVEFALRLGEVLPSEILIAEQELRRSDDYLHHALSANTETISQWGGALVPYSTNDLGFRDRDVREVAKTLNAGNRVLILGDSFSEALGVAYEDAFPHLLEQSLSESGTQTEVLSGGVSSYSPKFELRQLLQFFERGYETDVVVLMLDISDIHDEGSVYYGWTDHSEADRESKRLKQQRRIEEARREESTLANVLRLRLLGRSRIKNLQDPLYERSPRSRWTEQDQIRAKPWVNVGIALCATFVERIVKLCKRQRVEFYLGIYPHPPQLSGDHCIDSEYRRIFRGFASRNGIRLIDLFPAFCELASWSDFFIEGDIHWNARGHQLVARQLFEQLGDASR